jgi:hypothetical protein
MSPFSLLYGEQPLREQAPLTGEEFANVTIARLAIPSETTWPKETLA